jgi:hypothetical protein
VTFETQWLVLLAAVAVIVAAAIIWRKSSTNDSAPTRRTPGPDERTDANNNPSR